MGRKLNSLLLIGAMTAGSGLAAVPLAAASTTHPVSAKKSSVAIKHKTAKKGDKKTKTTAIHVKMPPAIEVEHSKYGVVLETGEGRTLYETTGNCTSTKCQGAWPPLVVTSKPSYGKGVNSKLVKETKLKSGLEQLSYGGHLLYEFIGDNGPHQYHGESLKTPYGIWHVVSAANGDPVAPKVTKKPKKTTKAKTTAITKKKTTTTKKW